MSDFPVFVVAISGDVPEHDLKKIADEMQDKFESIKGVLEVGIKLYTDIRNTFSTV